MANKNKPKGEEMQDDDNIEKLAAMLREQMELVQAQGKIQREEVGELQRAVRKLGGQIESLNSRIDSLEGKLNTEGEQVAVLKEEMRLSVNKEALDPSGYEFKISQLDNRMRELECVMGVSVWTEEKMVELITSVYVEMKSELWEDLDRKISESISMELQKRSRSVPARENVSGLRAASTPFNYTTKRTTHTPASLSEIKGAVLSQVDEETTDFEKTYVQPDKSVGKGVRSRAFESPETQQVRNTGPIQKPMSFDVTTLWDAYYAQFEIIAQVNGWDEKEKSAFLASSLKGQAFLVLGNLRPKDRRNFKCLVTALLDRFGSTYQRELSQVRFKNRVKQRDESLPKLSQEIEQLARLYYPEAWSKLQDVLARDQFIDALPDEEMQLKLKHERPKTLQEGLTLA
jgi:hypothetical protein